MNKKSLFKLSFLLFLLFYLGNLQAQAKIKSSFKNPGNLKMYVYQPKSKNKTKKPLVVALHGCSQKVNQFSKQTGWNKLADKNDFILLYPSQKIENNASLCFNWFNQKDVTKNGNGELSSIKSMIDYVVQNYDVDTSKIFIYGVSAGAQMAISLLSVYPNIFKAGAVLAAGPYLSAINLSDAFKVMRKGADSKTPEKWGELVLTQHKTNQNFPKLIIAHGTNDNVVNFKNSNELIKQWSYLQNIDTLPDIIKENYFSKYVTKLIYTDTLANEKIIFYKFLGLNHVIPIDPGNNERQGGKKSFFTKDIHFFSTYYIAKDFGIIN